MFMQIIQSYEDGNIIQKESIDLDSGIYYSLLENMMTLNC